MVTDDGRTKQSTTRVMEPRLDDLVCFDLYVASRRFTAHYRPLLEPYGLTYPQYLVLVALWEQTPQSIRSLAKRLQLDHGTLTPLLQRMETSDLISRRRSEEDERIVNVALTDSGDALRTVGVALHCALSEAVGLDIEELASLQRLLHKIAGAA